MSDCAFPSCSTSPECDGGYPEAAQWSQAQHEERVHYAFALAAPGAPSAVVTGSASSPSTIYIYRLSRRTDEAPLGTIVLVLSILATIGTWTGWSLGTRLVDHYSSGGFDPPWPRIWRMLFAITLGLLAVMFGILLLTYLDA